MRFGAIPIREATGSILAHTLRVRGAGVFKKGRLLSAADVAALAQAGHESVIGARLEPGDLAENAAAAAVAAAVAGPGVRPDEAFTGRCNLRAEGRGLLVVDAPAVDRLNGLDESVTLSCLQPFTLVETRTMVATVKIIPFAVPAEVVERCLAIGSGGRPLLRIAPLRAREAGLILTELPGTHPTVLERAARSQRTRLEQLGSRVARELRCRHDEAHVAAAIREMAAEGLSPILILGASAIVDRKDVIPEGVVAAGGVIDHLGMPVDPGNLLLLAHLDQIPVVGVPGCARSLKPSGFDWVLQRIVADLPVVRADLMGMGVGGFLQETPSRPQPRAGGEPDLEGHPPRVAAIVLAAGRSLRMGRVNKLLSEVDGMPMLARVVDAVLASSVRPVVVVTGHDAEAVRGALAGRAVEFAHNPDHASGMSSSLRVGLAAVGDKVDGALICLGDMPWVRAEHVEALVSAFDPNGDRPICVPVHDRKRGNPVLWPARHFAEMRRLEGDRGARDLLSRYGEEITYVPVPDEGVNLDVDTPETLHSLAGRLASRTESHEG